MSLAELTPREKEVCSYLKNGLSDPEIAEKLLISVHTVRDHVKNIFKKTNIQSRTKLVALLNQSFYSSDQK